MLRHNRIVVIFVVIVAWGLLAIPSFAAVAGGDDSAQSELGLFADVQGEPLTDEEAEMVEGEGFFRFLFARKGKNKKPKKPKKRERNKKHPNGEEHNRRQKGPPKPAPRPQDHTTPDSPLAV